MKAPEIVHFFQLRLIENGSKNGSENGSGKMKPPKKQKKSADFTRNQRIFGPSGGI
ncbi:hypothetical protein [Dysosmobacter welbionis]|uniref:hypothetical protein n=1 Tax=Dysosmobacter welbionis TaxID=2093857 RepID=UPI002942CB0A|nr:hypothetical protein [Dysosmobacter welbionis]